MKFKNCRWWDEPWLFTSLVTALPVVPAGNSLNVLPMSSNKRSLLNMCQIMFVYEIG